MNINQAKKIAGIAPGEAVIGRAAIQQAAKECVKRAAAFHPDRNPNDATAKAAFLRYMEARDFWKKRIPHGCAVCGETIGRGATHCRLHQAGRTVKSLSAQAGFEPAAKAKVRESRANPNARVDVSPKGGWIARLGFYAKPVQKVFVKWQRTIGEVRAQRCFIEIAKGIQSPDRRLSLARVPRAEWQCALELGAALASVVCNRTSPGSWLLNHIHHLLHIADGVTDYDGWKKIAEHTGGNGWPKFSPGTLTKTAERLQINTPDSAAKSYRRAVKTKTG